MQAGSSVCARALRRAASADALLPQAAAAAGGRRDRGPGRREEGAGPSLAGPAALAPRCRLPRGAAALQHTATLFSFTS